MSPSTNETVMPVPSARANKRRRGGRGRGRKTTQNTAPVALPPKPIFNIGYFYRLAESEKKEKVLEYFAWAGDLDENHPFDINYRGMDQFSKDEVRLIYSVWETKRNYVRGLVAELKKLAVKIADVRTSYNGTYICSSAWCALNDLFKAQHKNYLEAVAETNAFRKANLVWDSVGIVPFDFTTLMG